MAKPSVRYSWLGNLGLTELSLACSKYEYKDNIQRQHNIERYHSNTQATFFKNQYQQSFTSYGDVSKVPENSDAVYR